MRIHIAHETVYRYEAPARGLIQTLRLTPRDHDGQHVRAWRIEPSADGLLRRDEDTFCNLLHLFSADNPVRELAIRVTGEVETNEMHGLVRGSVERLPEIFYLRDVFESRMNTLFKIYYQVWLVFGLASAVALVVAWAVWPAPAWRRASAAVAGAAALLLGLAYPLVATPQWTDRFGAWRGLDGIAYAAARHPDEHAAITWLRENAAVGDVVVEAAGCSYEPNGDLPFNRVSAYTGIPTIIGWGNNHQPQWRRGQPELIAAIPEREEDVAAIYGDPSGTLADRYGADWLYVGTYEAGDWRHLCPAAGPYPGIDQAGFPGPAWSEAFRSGDVAIYRRTGAGV